MNLSTKNIYQRKRSVQLSHERYTFVEYYVAGSGQHLEWPKECPKRFEGRISSSLSIENICFQEVKSEPPALLQKRDLATILRDGLWITRNDIVPSGGLPELKIAAQSQIFGISIRSPWPWQDFCSLHAKLQKALLLKDQDPTIVQHGTSRDHIKEIHKNGLKPGPGMLGNAIYLGTFWKAWRQAVMNSEWVPRVGSLLRILAFWPRVFLRVPGVSKCSCGECVAWTRTHGPDAVSWASDHLQTWSRTDVAVLVPPIWLPNGTYTVKNAEQACIDNKYLFQEGVGFVGTQQLIADRDPLKRDITID